MKNGKKTFVARKSRIGRRAKKSVPKVSTAVKSYVKSAIHRNIENKFFNHNRLNELITCAQLTTPYNINLLPTFVRGTNSSQILGDDVKIVKANLKGYVNLLPYNATTNPYSPAYIKMWIISSKRYNTSALVDTNIANTFFDAGNSSTPVGFQGNLLDMMLPVNRNEFVVHTSKTFKVGQPTTGPNAGAGNWVGITDNRSMTMPFNINYGKYVKTMLKYAEGSAYCTNRNLWAIFTVAYADGRDDTPAAPAEVHFSMNVSYEDA